MIHTNVMALTMQMAHQPNFDFAEPSKYHGKEKFLDWDEQHWVHTQIQRMVEMELPPIEA